MKFNLINSAAHWNISSGNAAHYIKRLDIPGLDCYLGVSRDFSLPNSRSFPGPPIDFPGHMKEKNIYIQSFYTLLLTYIKIFFKIFYCGKNDSTKNYSGTMGRRSLGALHTESHWGSIPILCFANEQITIRTKKIKMNFFVFFFSKLISGNFENLCIQFLL